ncbi:NAD-dependent succinate-semialdehyde dehydrogenase [Nocardia fluminea]|uniref:NAD-dependent succinate-semialdehyde dehydrogenase n=1 Tax=Nocardia fluminea TaxID=134984 RepID=UPI00370FD82D
MTSYAVTDPTTGVVLESYPTASDGDIEVMLDRSAVAQRDWGRDCTVAERADLLGRVAELYVARSEQLAAVIGREMGKPVTQALGEVEFAAAIYQYYADNAVRFLADEPIELAWGGEGSAVVRRSALGTVLGIMPWNYPYYQVARFAAPSLMIGNTVVLKHAAQCPESAALIEQIFADAGYPVGAYQNLYATYEQIENIIADDRIAAVSVTGSERAGSLIAEIAGRHLKKAVLELGGSDPFIVLSTDDLDATVDAAVAARFAENAGQACNGPKRFIVVDELYDAFVEKLTTRVAAMSPGHPSDSHTVLGPLSSESAAADLAAQIARSVSAGAKVAFGGSRTGAFIEPTILVDIDSSNPASKEEFFGPVASLFRVASEDEAISVANDTPFGLGSYVFTTDPDQAQRVADRLDVGMVFVNLVGAEEPGLPFGGVKRSGFGRELGPLGVDEFVNRKVIRIGASTT